MMPTSADGLVAMITVRDPIGINQFDEGGHGSAFDRVGVFQVGFTEGVARCTQLTDTRCRWSRTRSSRARRRAMATPRSGSVTTRSANFIASDLNDFWASALAAHGVTVPTLTVQPVASMADAACDEPSGNPAAGAVYCPATQQVFLDQRLAQDLYDQFGDFVVGYLLGDAWSEAAQIAMGSPLQGEARARSSTTASPAPWAATLIPDASGTSPPPYIEPGDLDEAIQAAVVVGDDSTGDDVLGSGFEKIASFPPGCARRTGRLHGADRRLRRWTPQTPSTPAPAEHAEHAEDDDRDGAGGTRHRHQQLPPRHRPGGGAGRVRDAHPRAREVVRLGHGGGDMNVLSADAVDVGSPACGGCAGSSTATHGHARAVLRGHLDRATAAGWPRAR